MYFGSVRFFKHIILAVVAAMVVVPTALSIHFGMAYYDLQARTDSTEDAGSAGERLSALYDSPAAQGGINLIYASESNNAKAKNYSSMLPYQSKYPNLYVENDFQFAAPKDKMVYLTFDDGPSSLTPKILDVLKENNVKATFFIVYKDSDTAKALYRRMIDEGHTIGVHSTSHIYKEIYKSVDTYLTDFAQTAQMLEAVTGLKPELFRFPGGSVNVYNRSVYMPIIAEMTRRGYTYYDWNVGSEDTASKKSTQSIYESVTEGVRAHRQSIVLMHDLASHDTTLEALPKIIKTLKEEGYTFAPLDKTVKPAAFGYPD